MTVGTVGIAAISWHHHATLCLMTASEFLFPITIDKQDYLCRWILLVKIHYLHSYIHGYIYLYMSFLVINFVFQ